MCIYCLQIPPIIGPIQPFSDNEGLYSEEHTCCGNECLGGEMQ